MKYVRCENENGRQELMNLRYVSVVARGKDSYGEQYDEIFCNISYSHGRWVTVAPNKDGKRVFEDAVVDI